MKFVVHLEETGTGYSAYSPDVRGVYSAGETIEETLGLFRNGLKVLFELIREEGGEVPIPKFIAATVEVDDVA